MTSSFGKEFFSFAEFGVDGDVFGTERTARLALASVVGVLFARTFDRSKMASAFLLYRLSPIV